MKNMYKKWFSRFRSLYGQVNGSTATHCWLNIFYRFSLALLHFFAFCFFWLLLLLFLFFDKISNGNSVLFTICILCVQHFVAAVVVIVVLRYCSLMLFFVAIRIHFFFSVFSPLFHSLSHSIPAILLHLFRVFWGRTQKQSYVHNNLRFSVLFTMLFACTNNSI